MRKIEQQEDSIMSDSTNNNHALSADELWAQAADGTPISREELGISKSLSSNGLTSLNEGLEKCTFWFKENTNYKWYNVEKDGYPYTLDEFDDALKNSNDDLLKDYLLTDGEDYFIGYWRPDGKAWDNCNSGWVRKYYDPEAGDKSLANIKWYMELPKLPEG